MQTQAQLALMSPGPAVTALRQVVGELLDLPGVTGHIAGLMAGSDLAYRMHAGTAHAVTGRFAPELDLRISSRTTRLAELLRAGRPLLVDLTGSGHLADLIGAWRDRVDLVRAHAQTPPAEALLILPDGYVAWALGPDGTDGLLDALATWFGTPNPESAGGSAGPGRS
ncbi:hypothetical protein ACQP2Y_24310 [Actinoplanes sp. CA-051413]|uniref:aromatic-ring hydroxylase C-terminal domain-containing protein n=1 Tax=Actinoplanes sp. CA-051413 TaxID=3239899 RepID=UPI003D98173F